MTALLFGLVFAFLVVVLLVTFAIASAVAKWRQNNQVRAMLRTADPVVAERTVQLLRPRSLSNDLSAFLHKIGLGGRLGLLLDQAGLDWSGTSLVLATVAAASVGAVAALQFSPADYRFECACALALAAGSIPVLVVRRKRAKRWREFEEQLPEALDFLARSLRAGHAFSVGLEMLVTDSPEPLANIFRRALHDLHLGSSLEASLRKIVEVAPLIDARFFVSSVLLQQETGGNLSEILLKLAGVIRERFEIKGQVKAAAAHGKITGLVLVVLPIVVAILLFFISPAYLGMLLFDHTGRMLILASIAGQILGFFCIRKITDIKV